jgi:predicted branched-subunit amino acid permease
MIRNPLSEAIRDSLATFFAYFPLGIVFGFLFTSELSLPWILAPFMSLMVFAGAIQFVALGIFAAQGSIIYSNNFKSWFWASAKAFGMRRS